MKKDTIARMQALSKGKKNSNRRKTAKWRLTVGLDLGDRTSRYYIFG
jgi:hypothetical protein